MFQNYICALDIGASKISASVVVFKGRQAEAVYFESLFLKVLSKGTVIESIELTGAVERVLEALKAKSGVHIKSVYVNISGRDIVVKHSHALVPLWDKRGKVITVNDIRKVNEQALILGQNIDEEVLTSISNTYTVDLNKEITNPVGIFSHKLGVDVTLVCGKIASVRSFYHVVNRAGYDVKELIFSGLATSGIIFDENNREGLQVFCDIGGDMIELLIFKDGFLQHFEIVQTGGDEITRSLQEELKISFELAEEIKHSYGVIGAGQEGLREKEILLKENDLYKPVKQGVVMDIVTKKARGICEDLKERVSGYVQLKEVKSFFAVGRSILQEGFLELLEGTMGMPVRLGRIVHPGLSPRIHQKDCVLSGQKYLTYLTSLGIVCWVLDKQKPQVSASNRVSRNPAVRLLDKIREIYREYF